jgi:dephospho-CoA kinase
LPISDEQSVSQQSQVPEKERPKSRVVVCITGMPGAGKSSSAEALHELGFEIFRMGDDVRMEAERRHVPPTDENLGNIMKELRDKGGPVAIAVLCEQRIERDSKSPYVVIDGIRNIIEFHQFKKLGRAILVAILADPKRRFEFLQNRARSDSPGSYESFEARDRRELSVGIGDAIAKADEVIANNGTLDDLKRSMLTLFNRIKS